MPAEISLSAVARVFPDGSGLGPISVTLGPDHVTALVGPSGCGKSTLLRLLAGLDTPTSGELRGVPERIGYVFQEPRLMPWLSARENVALAADLRNGNAERADVEAALDRVRLPAAARTKRPHELSGGMRMRTAVARALVDRAELLLLDEPFGALDALSRDELDDEVRRLCRESPRPTLFVTHDVAEAVYVADRVLVLARSPGVLAKEIDVPFGSDRDRTVRGDASFAAVVRDVVTVLTGPARAEDGRRDDAPGASS